MRLQYMFLQNSYLAEKYHQLLLGFRHYYMSMVVNTNYSALSSELANYSKDIFAAIIENSAFNGVYNDYSLGDAVLLNFFAGNYKIYVIFTNTLLLLFVFIFCKLYRLKKNKIIILLFLISPFWNLTTNLCNGEVSSLLFVLLAAIIYKLEINIVCKFLFPIICFVFAVYCKLEMIAVVLPLIFFCMKYLLKNYSLKTKNKYLMFGLLILAILFILPIMYAFLKRTAINMFMWFIIMDGLSVNGIIINCAYISWLIYLTYCYRHTISSWPILKYLIAGILLYQFGLCIQMHLCEHFGRFSKLSISYAFLLLASTVILSSKNIYRIITVMTLILIIEVNTVFLYGGIKNEYRLFDDNYSQMMGFLREKIDSKSVVITYGHNNDEVFRINNFVNHIFQLMLDHVVVIPSWVFTLEGVKKLPDHKKIVFMETYFNRGKIVSRQNQKINFIGEYHQSNYISFTRNNHKLEILLSKFESINDPKLIQIQNTIAETIAMARNHYLNGYKR
ncbi:MAG: hypothetical protein HQK53_01710 [Oligoflexia bacterium]|nr:hypothetical protein [Oligoflexia bacterium]